MTIFRELLNQESIFRGLKTPPIIVNDLYAVSEEQRERILNNIRTIHKDDVMSSMDSCECGLLVGTHKRGHVCNTCLSVCQKPISHDFESILWVRAPNGVRPLMTPQVRLMLRNRFSKVGNDLIMWLTDRDYRPSSRPIPEYEQLLSLGVQRGYNWFYDNFDELLDTLYGLKGFERKPKNAGYHESIDLYELIKSNRDCIFSNYLPMPNRSLLVIEKTNVGSYAKTIDIGAIDAIQSMLGIDSPVSIHNTTTKENRTARALDGLTNYIESVYGEVFGGKTGVFRKNAFGTREHFSTRTVATSITGAHDCKELHLSWGSGIGMLKYHLLNKLYLKDFLLNQSLRLIYKSADTFNPLINNIFNQLIAECRYWGIPVLHGRNPTLKRGSQQLLFITKIKKPGDQTNSFSINIVGPMNADYDGDQLNTLSLLDNYMTRGSMEMSPFRSAYSLDNVRGYSSDIGMSKQAVTMTANYFWHQAKIRRSANEESFIRQLERESA